MHRIDGATRPSSSRRTTTPASGDRRPGSALLRRLLRLRRLGAVAAATAVTASTLTVTAAPPAAADASTQCSFPAKPFKGRPWSLQRVLLNELWQNTDQGAGVRVAVIDTGVDIKNEQLKDAVDADAGKNLLPKKPKKDEESGRATPRGKANGTSDEVGHGTKVAGIIAARPAEGTGFVGLAPKATIIPIKQNDANGSGTAATLADSIDYAVEADADIINISQDTAEALQPDSELEQAVQRAVEADVVVIASAGNDGLGGRDKKTYPASYPGVLAVAASDRNNERAPFSQAGDFVDVAAPGVDMVSTVPRGGHCVDNGTSFSAPYVAGVAALLRAKHDKGPDRWSQQNIVAQIEQTAERSIPGHDRLVGWGVVDPVAALTEDDKRITRPVAEEGVETVEKPTPAKLQLGETEQERNERLGTYVLVGGGTLVAVVAGSSLIYRDWRRRKRPATTR
ncbi:type VII secretion-associated serine protease mycosin [Streptomyces spirodelae]|uniref:Type VII secretion-associated serine protease mycosin n=1 Tax=Streptomyces spirodelae TaxID=2812904 RepID=A0ABS3X2P8_9ACTN|nr:type VII secretion-associated serine protease mycosin [Streptomyces spirodelae]MBO8189655.1 type VII secretion-associated serine protease mycosin [Streptomyces spirodelae]